MIFRSGGVNMGRRIVVISRSRRAEAVSRWMRSRDAVRKLVYILIMRNCRTRDVGCKRTRFEELFELGGTRIRRDESEREHGDGLETFFNRVN
jgi:hypothetical protein